MIGKKFRNRDRGSSKAVRIRRLVDYIRAPQTENAGEKCVYSGARGFVTDDADTHIQEMIALALDAPRSRDPIVHYVLSWREDEHPTSAQIEEAVDILEAELDVRPQQKLYALHADTDNLHLHIILNRVDPDTLTVKKINKGFDFKALHRACARIGHVQGWKSEKNAQFRVNKKGEVVPVSSKRKKRGGKPTQHQRDNELWQGEKSAARLAIEFAGPILARARSWTQAHSWLSKFEMRYLRAGSGAVVQVGDVRVKASTVSRSATLLELEKRFGPYVPPNDPESENKSNRSQEEKEETPDAKPVPNPKAAWPYIREARTWRELHRALAQHDMRYEKTGSGATIFAGRNDEISMKASKVSRKATLRQLEARFGPYLSPPGHEFARPDLDSIYKDFPRWKGFVHATQDDAEKERAARDRLNAELRQQADEEERQRTRHQEERAELFCQQSWEGRLAVLHLQRSLLAAEHAKEKEELDERLRFRRQELVKAFPAKREYGDWIDDPELSLLWDRRLSRPACIEPSGRGRRDIARRPKHDIRDYQAHPVGSWVIYTTSEQRARGEIGFVDRNDRVDIHDSRNEFSILAALQLASEKWGRIGVKGDRAYLETCARLAAVHGFKIGNPGLQETILKYRRMINEQQSERKVKEVALTTQSGPPGSRSSTHEVRGRSKARRGGYDPW